MTALVSDSFNRANSSTLGTADTGQTWSLISGSFAISSDQVQPTGSTDVAVIDSGSSDATIDLDLYAGTSGNAVGITFRYSDPNNYWYAYCYQSGRAVIGYVNAGTNKALAGANATYSNGTTLQVVLSGSSITVNVGGVQVLTRTDTFNETATQHGLYFSNTGTAADNFSVAVSGAPTNVEGNASFTGSNTFSATVDLQTTNVEGAASFAGSDSLSAMSDMVQQTVEASAQFNASSDMSATAQVVSGGNAEGSTTFTGNSTMDASSDIIPAPNIEGSAEYQGDGTLSANGSMVGNQVEGDATFSGSSNVIADADVKSAPNVEASAGFTGDGSMSAQEQIRKPVSALFGGSGALSAHGVTANEVHVQIIQGDASLYNHIDGGSASLDNRVSGTASLDNKISMEGDD